MEAHVVGRLGLDQEAHLGFGRSVVPIVIYYRRQVRGGQQRDLSLPVGVVPGVITVSAPRFCHIVTSAWLLSQKPDKYRYEVKLPNGSAVRVSMTHVQQYSLLAAFFIELPTAAVPPGTVEAVQFSNLVSENEPMRMFGYFLSPFPPERVLSHLTDGFMTHPGPALGFFQHDCTVSYASCPGSPLFDDQGRLVGISHKSIGVTRAISVDVIKDHLVEIYRSDDMSISEIVEYLEGEGVRIFGN